MLEIPLSHSHVVTENVQTHWSRADKPEKQDKIDKHLVMGLIDETWIALYTL